MKLQHKVLTKILAAKFQIDKKNMIAFRGRMQHMQRLGFPPGSNTGKGRPSIYGWRQLFLLAMAFEYLEIGATPDRAVAELFRTEDEVIEALKNVAKALIDDSNEAELAPFLLVDLSAIQLLKAPQKGPNVKVLPMSKLIRTISEFDENKVQTGFAFIDLSRVVSSLIDCFATVTDDPKSEIARSLSDWSESSPNEHFKLKIA